GVIPNVVILLGVRLLDEQQEIFAMPVHGDVEVTTPRQRSECITKRRPDRYFARSALIRFELEVHRLRDAMCRAEIFDRIPGGWHWRSADRRRLRVGRRIWLPLGGELDRRPVCARWSGRPLRFTGRLGQLFAGDFSACHRPELDADLW